MGRHGRRGRGQQRGSRRRHLHPHSLSQISSPTVCIQQQPLSSSSIKVALSLSLSHYLSLFLCFSHSVSLTLSPLSLSHYLSLFLCFSHSLSLSHYLSLSLSLSLRMSESAIVALLSTLACDDRGTCPMIKSRLPIVRTHFDQDTLVQLCHRTPRC